VRVALCQLNPQDDKQANLRRAFDAVAESARRGAEVVVLPEMFSFMGADSERFVHADLLGQGVFADLATAAALHNIALIGGSTGERTLSDVQRDDIPIDAPAPHLIYNTSQSFGPDGAVLNTYRKAHLFSLRNENNLVSPEFREADWCLAGEPPRSCFDLHCSGQVWRALVLICFDLRFPEIFRMPELRRTPPDIVFIPAAFTYRTGRDHWEILLRARAIENQCYIVACNQTGTFCTGSKRNYGHSMVISPWGEVLQDLGEDDQVAIIEIDLDRVRTVRAQLPALASRLIN